MQHIKIFTDFDITNTGVIRNYKEGTLPVKIGRNVIHTMEEWILKRRQQSNWETMIQIISLRAQVLNLQTIELSDGWCLEFDIEATDVYQCDNDPVGLLKNDFSNVPLLTGLTEHTRLSEFVVVDQNIRFKTYEL
jgi:hypothetical protein